MKLTSFLSFGSIVAAFVASAPPKCSCGVQLLDVLPFQLEPVCSLYPVYPVFPHLEVLALDLKHVHDPLALSFHKLVQIDHLLSNSFSSSQGAHQLPVGVHSTECIAFTII